MYMEQLLTVCSEKMRKGSFRRTSSGFEYTERIAGAGEVLAMQASGPEFSSQAFSSKTGL